MIDTKELRRLAQAASHPTTKGRWIRLFGERTVYDRMEDGCRGIPVVSTDTHPPSPSEAARLDFIAAANPAVFNELLDRLEAAEKEHNALCAELLDAKKTTRELFHNANVANMTITTLQAKIAEMENQKPVAWMSSRNGFIVKENKNPDYNLPLIHAPGAKGE